MCGIHNQNFLSDLKISWEPGSQVPRDSPALLASIVHDKHFSTLGSRKMEVANIKMCHWFGC